MRFFTLAFILSFCVMTTIKAQNNYADNLEFDLDGNDIIINYNLKEIYPLQYYTIEIKTIVGKDSLHPKLSNLEGDIGFVGKGGAKTIIWKNAVEPISKFRKAQETLRGNNYKNDTIVIQLKVELYRKPPLISVVELSDKSTDEWAKIVEDNIEVHYELPSIQPSQYYFTHLKVYLGDSLIRPHKDSISGDFKRIETSNPLKTILWKGAVKDLEAYDERITFELNVLLADRLPNVSIRESKGKTTQQKVTIVNDSLLIEYDIPSTNLNKWFDVKIWADLDGEIVKPADGTTEGDIGDIRKGGLDQEILWKNAIDTLEFYKRDVTINLNITKYFRRFDAKRQSPHYLFWAAGIGAVYYGYDLRKKSQNIYTNQYLVQNTFQSAEPYYQSANKLHQQYLQAKYAGIGIFALNTAWYFYRQKLNKRRKAKDFLVSNFQLTLPKNSVGLGVMYQF